MKFTIELEDPMIEQYDDEGDVIGEEEFSIQSYLLSEMKKTLKAKFGGDSVEKIIQTKIDNRLNTMVTDGIIKEINNLSDRFMTEYLDREIIETDRWGEKIYKGTLKDKIHEAFDKYMTGTVDDNGKPSSSSYHTLYKRADYMIKCLLDKKMREFTDSTIKEVKVAVEEKLTEELKVAVGKGVIDSIGIPRLLENIKGGK